MKLSGLLGEEMHAAVYVGIHRIVFLRDGVDHTSGLLRRGTVVKIDKRTAIDRAAQDGKVFAYLCYIHDS